MQVIEPGDRRAIEIQQYVAAFEARALRRSVRLHFEHEDRARRRTSQHCAGCVDRA